MAADYPTYLNNGHTARVTLRDGMVWRYNNGTTVPINADDVEWTFTTILNPQSGCTGTGDFIYVIDNVTKVDNLTVDINLKYACPDILSILSNDWGTGCILPKHKLEGIALTQLGGHPSNTAFNTPSEWMPVSGPFMLDPANSPEPDVDITLIKNPSYYGYNTSIVGSPAWGPYNIDKFKLQWMRDPAARLTALINNDIDFGEYPIAPVDTFKDLNDTETYPYLRVIQYDYPASTPIWLNFNNEYLSNRYIRMAIAHAIDYDYIIDTLLLPWGIETATRGKTPILPHHYYTDENGTTVHLYNTALSPYVQNVTKAQAYMDRWKFSQEGSWDYLKGAAGDADFSGKVDLDDFYIWRDKGWPLVYPETVTFLPGQDIDPDFNNDGSYDLLPDYSIWYIETYDLTYP